MSVNLLQLFLSHLVVVSYFKIQEATGGESYIFLRQFLSCLFFLPRRLHLR